MNQMNMEFAYLALDRTGAERQGTLRAESWRSAVEELERAGFTVVSLRQTGAGGATLREGRASRLVGLGRTPGPAQRYGLVPQEVAAEDRELAQHWPAVVAQARTLIPLLRAYAAESPHPLLRRRARRLAAYWERLDVHHPGAGRHPLVASWVPTLLADRAAPAEHFAIRRMSREFARQPLQEPSTRLWGWLIYSVFMFAVIVAVHQLLGSWLIPIFADFFGDFAMELPQSTALLFAWIKLTRSGAFWFGLLVAGVALGALGVFLRTSEQGQKLLRIRSWFGSWDRGWSRWADDVRQLLKAAMPLGAATRLAGLASASWAVQTRVQHWNQRVAQQQGANAVEAASAPAAGVTSADKGAQTAPGELTESTAWDVASILPAPLELALRQYAAYGDGGELLDVVAQAYQDRHVRRWSAWAAFIPPLAVTLIGLFIGFVVIALYAPLVSLIGGLT